MSFLTMQEGRLRSVKNTAYQLQNNHAKAKLGKHLFVIPAVISTCVGHAIGGIHSDIM